MYVSIFIFHIVIILVSFKRGTRDMHHPCFIASVSLFKYILYIFFFGSSTLSLFYLTLPSMATSTATHSHNPALDPDSDAPDNPAHEFAQFGAGCFWGVELAFQRLVGVVKTEVGYSQGHVPDPNYKLVCSGTTNHVEVVRVQFDPQVCPYTSLLSLFWSRHDPTTLNRQVRLSLCVFLIAYPFCPNTPFALSLVKLNLLVLRFFIIVYHCIVGSDF